MFLRLAPTLAHWLSLKACPKWPQHFLQIRSVAGPFFIVAPPPSEASLRLRGRGLGLGTGAAPFSSPLHSGNWNAASLVGLLGADTVTWGVGGGSCSTADRTRSGSGNRDRSESTRTTSCRSSPLRRGNRSEKPDERDSRVIFALCTNDSGCEFQWPGQIVYIKTSLKKKRESEWRKVSFIYEYYILRLEGFYFFLSFFLFRLTEERIDDYSYQYTLRSKDFLNLSERNTNSRAKSRDVIGAV